MLALFLVARSTFLCISLCLDVLVIISAGLNITAAKSLGISAPSSTSFVLFDSCFLFVWLLATFLDLLFSIKYASVGWECFWAALIGILQLAAAIDATLTGPPVACQAQFSRDFCASSYLQMSTIWLSSLTTLIYTVFLITTAFAHMESCPTIFSSSIYSVRWFVDDKEPTHGLAGTQKNIRTEDEVAGLDVQEQPDVANKVIEVKSALPSKGESNVDRTSTWLPQWATKAPHRRAIDPPFTTKLNEGPIVAKGTSGAASLEKEMVPIDSSQRKSWASRYGVRPALAPSMQDSGKHSPNRRFPLTANPNLPIALPHTSEWIPANTAGNTAVSPSSTTYF